MEVHILKLNTWESAPTNWTGLGLNSKTAYIREGKYFGPYWKFRFSGFRHWFWLILLPKSDLIFGKYWNRIQNQKFQQKRWNIWIRYFLKKNNSGLKTVPFELWFKKNSQVNCFIRKKNKIKTAKCCLRKSPHPPNLDLIIPAINVEYCCNLAVNSLSSLIKSCISILKEQMSA